MNQKEKFEEKFFAAMQTSLIAGVFIVPFTVLVIFVVVLFRADTGKFGQVGDFIGGVLNPLVAFMGLVVSIFVGIQVKLLTEATINSAQKIAGDSLKNDQIIAERQIKYEEYKIYMSKVDQCFDEWEADKQSKDMFERFDREKLKWDKKINHLFPSNFFGPNNINLVAEIKRYRGHFEDPYLNSVMIENEFPTIKAHYNAVLSDIAFKALKNLD